MAEMGILQWNRWGYSSGTDRTLIKAVRPAYSPELLEEAMLGIDSGTQARQHL